MNIRKRKPTRSQRWATSFYMLIAVIVYTFTGLQHSAAQRPVEGKIEKVWLEERIKIGDRNGMRIHVSFNVKNAIKGDCRVRAPFFTAGGNRIISPRGADDYSTAEGHAIVTKAFSPPYESTDYPDTKLSVPYWILNLKESNENKMKFYISVLCGEKVFLTSQWVSFSVPLGKAVR